MENKLIPYWRALYLYKTLPQPPPPSGFLWSLRLGARIGMGPTPGMGPPSGRGSMASSSPVVMDGTLYIGLGNRLFSIDIRRHEVRWVFEACGAIRSSPAVVGTTIYVGSEDGRLYALDASTGGKLWDILTRGKITSSPAAADATVYVASHDGNLYAFE
jgi:outer membrane protein assembly factor BamB